MEGNPDLAAEVSLAVPGCAGEDDGHRVCGVLVEAGDDVGLSWVFEQDWLYAGTLRRALNSLVIHVVVAGDGTVLTEKKQPVFRVHRALRRASRKSR